MQYLPDDVLTFANGMVGTVTTKMRLALVAPNGWTVKAQHMPYVSVYTANHQVVKLERRGIAMAMPLAA